ICSPVSHIPPKTYFWLSLNMHSPQLLTLIEQDVKDRELILNLLLSLHEHLASVA
ncbi:hypothetical protein M9458_009707, partial [Cirrhinus mrigala]